MKLTAVIYSAAILAGCASFAAEFNVATADSATPAQLTASGLENVKAAEALCNGEETPVTIDLVPIGFTRLRETYLKTAK